MTNERLRRLTVICESRKRDDSGHEYFWTICSCGNLFIVRKDYLKSGHTKSCGCLKKEADGKRIKLVNTKHGMYKTRIYRIWKHMCRRCKNPKCKDFKCYGARGIKVCGEWGSFIVFKDWAYANGYQEDLTIDRINNDGNYEPGNCQWITSGENSRKGSRADLVTN